MEAVLLRESSNEQSSSLYTPLRASRNTGSHIVLLIVRHQKDIQARRSTKASSGPVTADVPDQSKFCLMACEPRLIQNSTLIENGGDCNDDDWVWSA